MSTYYVYSGATGAANGSSWTDAYVTIGAAVAVSAAGDTIYVSNNHAESQTTSTTWTFPSSVDNPVKVICVVDTATPPTTLSDSSAYFRTSGAYSLLIAGAAYFYGLQLIVGNGSSSQCYLLLCAGTAGVHNLVFDKCFLRVATTSSLAKIYLGNSQSTNNDTGEVTLINSSIQLGATGQSISPRGIPFRWRNNGSQGFILGSVPNYVFQSQVGYNSPAVRIEGVDLSNLTGSLIDSSIDAPLKVKIRNCKLNVALTPWGGTVIGPGVELEMDNCDYGDTNYRMERYKYQGNVKTETVKVLTGGANDGTTTISWKITTNTTGASFVSPFESPEIVVWNDSVGSSKTVTVEILHDSITNLKDDEIWLEVQYLGTSGYPLGSIITDRKTDILSTAADQTTSTAIWTTTGLTNPNTQKLSVTFTPQEKGCILAKVMVAKANYIVYINPKITIS